MPLAILFVGACSTESGGSKSGSPEVSTERHKAIQKALKQESPSPFPDTMTAQFKLDKRGIWTASYGSDQSLIELCQEKKQLDAVYLKAGEYTSKTIKLLKPKGVRILLVSSLNVDPDMIAPISQFNDLRELRFRGISPSTDRIFFNLTGPKKLEMLEIRRAKITSAGISRLGKYLKGLTDFKVTDCPNAFKSRCLSNFKRLKILSVTNSPVDLSVVKEIPKLTTLTNLRLDSSGISDKEIALLKNLKLKWLVLSGSGITDKSIETISGIKSLTFLGLSGCPKISQAAIKRLKKRLVKCSIE